jgi:hypothetical protein
MLIVATANFCVLRFSTVVCNICLYPEHQPETAAVLYLVSIENSELLINIGYVYCKQLRHKLTRSPAYLHYRTQCLLNS